MAVAAIAMATSQKNTRRFTNKFPSHFRAAILSPALKTATPINREEATHFGVRNLALLLFGCLLFHIAGTWSLPLVDRDEPRFAEASREMIERGDYVVPHFNGQLRLDKPPLAYWAQVASYSVFGQTDFAARFPSAVAAALTAWSIFAWGRRIGGDRVGVWAAVIFSLSLQTFVHAKAAVADMWLVLFMTLAHWSGYELLRDGLTTYTKRPTLNVQRPTFNQGAAASRPPWATGKSPLLVFYLSLALGFLAKGPIGWTPLLTVGSTIFFARDLQLARRLKFVRGILFMLAIVAVWGIPGLIRTGGEFFWIGIGRHVVGRSFGAMEGHGANSLGVNLALLPFYFVTVFVSFFPWSIKLPWLTRQLWQKRDSTDNYLLAGTAVIFIIFTLIKTKLPHYTLPAFPLLALVLARHWSRQEYPSGSERDGFKPSRLRAANNRPAGAPGLVFRSVAIAVLCFWVAVALLLPPRIAWYFPAYALFQQSRDYLRPEMEFAALSYHEPSLVWYFRSRITRWMTPVRATDAAGFMQAKGPRFVILPTATAANLFPNVAGWKTFSSHGFNIAKGKKVDLTLLLKPE
jgi:4-amino-4-deoxy-L-arabinose transferase-like glycosyltransferase